MKQKPVQLIHPEKVKIDFFHVDPHPGNLASLIYYGFGMTGDSTYTNKRLLELFHAFYGERKEEKKRKEV